MNYSGTGRSAGELQLANGSCILLVLRGVQGIFNLLNETENFIVECEGG